jgi:hypothetical protein
MLYKQWHRWMVGGGVVLQNENLDKKNIFYAQEILNY